MRMVPLLVQVITRRKPRSSPFPSLRRCSSLDQQLRGSSQSKLRSHHKSKSSNDQSKRERRSKLRCHSKAAREGSKTTRRRRKVQGLEVMRNLKKLSTLSSKSQPARQSCSHLVFKRDGLLTWQNLQKHQVQGITITLLRFSHHDHKLSSSLSSLEPVRPSEQKSLTLAPTISTISPLPKRQLSKKFMQGL